jgi:acyl carrier protein phosphodiesterase
MNHLAHLLLSGDAPQHQLGNLLGDFIRGSLRAPAFQAAYPPAVREGVALHRRIDGYTDAHPLHRRSRQRWPAPWRRYGGILTDVLYDHYLCRHWQRFVHAPLRAFTRRTYADLLAQRALMPAAASRYVTRLAAVDGLGAYADAESLARVLAALDARLRRPAGLPAALAILPALDAELEADFLAFFPELIAHSGVENRWLHPSPMLAATPGDPS